ncbi:DUF3575 domain-containing protein [Mariniphaga sp.]|uniref:DUF3575 domain-containing protein n=1 Tax=Mariniphaga sp. TaxID=1954475 RepID=UPI0035621297
MSRLKVFAIVLILFTGWVSNAQENIIKAGLSGAFLGDFNLAYEKMFNSNRSLQMKFGYLNPVVSPFFTEETITPEAYAFIQENGGMSASLEYRFYISEKLSAEGFYIAPYLRWFNQFVDYEDEIDSRIYSVNTKLNTLGMGAQLGYQWIFGEMFTVDFHFLGIGLDYYMTKLIYTMDPKPAGFDYSEVTPHIEDVFSDIIYLKNRLKHEVNEDNHTSKLPFFFPGFRMGISLGFAF